MEYIKKLRQLKDTTPVYYTQQKLQSILNEQQCSETGESSINKDLKCNDETSPTTKKKKYADKSQKVCLPDYDDIFFGKSRRMEYTSTFRTQKKLVETCGAVKPDNLVQIWLTLLQTTNRLKFSAWFGD